MWRRLCSTRASILVFPRHPDGAPAVLKGVVVHGDKRGRSLGFPTANICISETIAPPEHGVYCCRVRLETDSRAYGATCSIGTNPTFDDVFDTRVEAYIHDFDRSIYGQRIELEILAFLRDMRRFSNVDELVAQTITDVERSRAMLARHRETNPSMDFPF